MPAMVRGSGLRTSDRNTRVDRRKILTSLYRVNCMMHPNLFHNYALRVISGSELPEDPPK
jgi:hypothetical protein